MIALLSRGRVVGVFSVVLLAVFVIALATDALPPLIGTVALILVLTGARQFDIVVAVAFSVIGVLLIILAAGMLAGASGLPLPETVAVAMAMAGCAGLAVYALVDRSRPVTLSSSLPFSAWFASAVGAIVWAVAYASSTLLEPAERLEWVVRNDSLNNLVFARMVMQEGGIAVGGDENPAPLPATVIALWALGSRSQATTEMILQNDLEAMALVWALLIGVTCMLSGLTVATIARAMGAQRLVLSLGAVIGSLLVLSWMVTGYPMLYGFLNTHLILPVLLSMILLALRAGDAPVASLAGLFCASTVILAVWAPFVVVPAALFMSVLVVYRKQLWPLAVWRRVVLVVSTAQLLAYGVLVTVPIYLEQRPALSGLGGIFDFASLIIPTVLGVTVLIVFSLRRGGRASQPIPVVLAVFASAIAGISFLLFLNRNAASIWSYYPIKFTWLMLIVVLIMAAGVLVGLSGEARTRLSRALFVSIAGALCAAMLAWMPTIGNGPLALNAVHRVAVGHVIDPTNGLTSGILENHRPEALTLLWESGEGPEGEINIWLVLLHIGSLDERTDLRILSLQAFTDRSVDMLCAISDEVDEEIVVVTASEDLEQRIGASCPGQPIEIRVRPST